MPCRIGSLLPSCDAGVGVALHMCGCALCAFCTLASISSTAAAGGCRERWRPARAMYSVGRRALVRPHAAWTARRKPARVEGGPLVCAVGTAVPDASRCCR